MHNAFRDKRFNPKREFFRIQIKSLGYWRYSVPTMTEGVARNLSASVTDEERRALEKERQRRPPLNFEEMGVPVGADLAYVRDPKVVATVEDAKKVNLAGEVVSLSPATRDLLGLSYYVAPTRYWTSRAAICKRSTATVDDLAI